MPIGGKMSKIQVGYGTGKPLSQKHGLYGTRRGGKKMINGGFNGAPTVDFTKVPDKTFIDIFGNSYIPKWKRELIEKGIPTE